MGIDLNLVLFLPLDFFPLVLEETLMGVKVWFIVRAPR